MWGGEDTANDLWSIVVWRGFGKSCCSYRACRPRLQQGFQTFGVLNLLTITTTF